MELCKLGSIHSAEIGQCLCGPGSEVEVEIKSEKNRFNPPWSFAVQQESQTDKQIATVPSGRYREVKGERMK